MRDAEDPARVFEFVNANQAIAPVATMCRVFEVSERWIYAWLRRGLVARAQRDKVMTVAIRAAHDHSDGSCGSPLIIEDLEARTALHRQRRDDDRDVPRGMTAREIQGFLAEQSRTQISPAFIDSVTDKVLDEVTASQ